MIIENIAKVTCFASKLEATGSSETLINFYLTVWCHPRRW